MFLTEKRHSLDKFRRSTLPPNEGGTATTLKVEETLLAEPPEAGLIRFSTDPDAALFVMGTTGKNKALKALFGSVSSYVARKAHCPVLLIPHEVSFAACKQVLFLGSHEAEFETILEQVLDLLPLDQAHFHFLYVAEQYTLDDTLKEMKYQKLLQRKLPKLDFTVVAIPNQKPLPAINIYANENDIDLVVMATSHRGFFADILHRSMTKRMIYNTDVPLLVMRFD